MKLRVIFIFLIAFIFSSFTTIQAQVDSVIGQLTNSSVESFAGGISGDGRFVVFESTGDLATENPRNSDGNNEIFIFDYAQRRIFQITDTKSLRTDTTLTYASTNINVLIVNTHPTISNDGRWIAFGSNATTSTPTAPNNTNPGSFNAESFNPVAPATTPANPLLSDANTEMWLYQVPAAPAANLSSGSEIPVTDLSAGTFTRVTNSLPSRVPTAGSTTALPAIGDDNRDASLSDNGNFLAFTSNRDLVPTVGNASPNANDEIFTYSRTLSAVRQITQTTRGSITDPIYNQIPSISGNGTRVAFQSNGDNPIVGMIGGNNADRSVEVFYADLDGTTGGTTTTSVKKQVTKTTRVNPGDVINIFSVGRRMSRDGRYIAFDSYATDLSTVNGANSTSFVLYLYDATTDTFKQIGPRSDADATATGGDVDRFPGFTDTDANGSPATLVFETRLNLTAAGTVSATNDGGLNTNVARPAQLYSYPITSASPTFTRLTLFPTPTSFIASTQPIPSNSVRRMTFTLALTEIGTGNPDLANEAFYYLLPVTDAQTAATFSFATGASRQPVSPDVVPTPSPTPTPSPVPSVTPTPQTPSAVQGLSPGSLAILDFSTGVNSPVVAQTAVGSLSRSFTLPIELSGVTLSINGAAAGLKSVGQREIIFVVPPGLPIVSSAATVYPVVVNNNGTVFRGSITIVPARPDVFTFSTLPAPNGRARIFNVTNTVFRTEPFNVTTLKIKGGRRVPTILRLFLTGVANVPISSITVRIGSVTITPTINAVPVLREPGVYSIDFALPPELLGAGDVPVIVNVGGTTYQSRLDDTAPRFRIL